MKKFYLMMLFCGSLYNVVTAQQSTEVFLAKLKPSSQNLSIVSISNISNNEGYDNQPSFYDNESVIYSRTRNGQTDIARYNIKDSTTVWLSNTPNGSEYSPLKIPDSEAISTIRLDNDGTQRLYKYDLKTKNSSILIKDLKVGYHVWYAPHILICTTLVENRMDLVVVNLKDESNYTIEKNVGRSLYKIPNTELVSFISKGNDTTKVKSLHQITRDTKDIISLVGSTEDVYWTSNGNLIAAHDKNILSYNPSTDQNWQLAFTFQEKNILGITRLSVSPKGTYMALVSKDAPDKIVQQQVQTFNARNLEGFVGCYTQDVVVSNFPADTLYTGRQTMYKKYAAFYEKTPEINVKVNTRIIIGAHVIDEEIVSVGEKQHKQVAIYKTDGLIKNMSFIKDQKTDTNPELIINEQLKAYNARDIEGFLKAYSNTIKIYNYPNNIRTEGLENMREGYANFFNTTADLHCKINNRIVIGNKVIDQELITANGTTFEAVLIYEVENGKITRVTSLR